MKTISLIQAYALLTAAKAVIVDQSALVYPSLDGLIHDPENEFLYLSWMNEDGESSYAKFLEGENETPQLDGSDLHLLDREGQSICLTLLIPATADWLAANLL